MLITGCGSLGQALTLELLKYSVHAIRLLDVSENALYDMIQLVGSSHPRVRLLQGDVRNKDRMRLALQGVHYVIHTAALKSADIAEANPFETIDVNLNGTITTISEAMRAGVSRFVAISSDKALLDSTAGVYHATKYLVERVTLWANRISNKTRFSCVRPANFVPSRMSVVDTWYKQYKSGQPLTVTSPEMKRYFMPIEQAAKDTIRALTLMRGGEIFVPDATAYNILDLVKSAGLPYQITSPRPGDRTSEELMSEEEKARAKRIRGMWVLK